MINAACKNNKLLNNNMLASNYNVKSCKGFTLIELLIAISLLALMTGIYALSIHSASKSSERMQNATAQLMTLQHFFERLESETFHSVEQTENGQPAFIGGPNGLRFVYGGLPNPKGLFQRSPLQTVSYHFFNAEDAEEEGIATDALTAVDENDQKATEDAAKTSYLQITYGTVFKNNDEFGGFAEDASDNTSDNSGEHSETIVLSNIESIVFSYLSRDDNGDYEWLESWEGMPSLHDMPLAVKVTVTRFARNTSDNSTDDSPKWQVYRYFPIAQSRF